MPCSGNPRATRVDSKNTPAKLREQLLSLPRAQMSLITQLRIGHAPLNRHLHRIKKHDHPTCDACGAAPESVRHFMLECPAHALQRQPMMLSLGRGYDRLDMLLSTPTGIAATIKYARATRRFDSSHDLAKVPRPKPPPARAAP